MNGISESGESGEALCLLGVTVHRVTMESIHDAVLRALHSGGQLVVGHHNLHSIYLYHKDPVVQRFYRDADIIHIDGMSLVLYGRLLKQDVHREHRITYVDWIDHLLEFAVSNRFRIYYLGSTPEANEKALRVLRTRFPGLCIEGTHGYFDAQLDSAQNEEIVGRINRYRPHILMVGMGMPRQERWVFENRRHLQASVIMTCGACMDYVAGVIPTPPRWMGGLGIEWLYRLVAEPGRLWKRYLVEPWFLLGLVLRDTLACRRRTMKGNPYRGGPSSTP